MSESPSFSVDGPYHLRIPGRVPLRKRIPGVISCTVSDKMFFGYKDAVGEMAYSDVFHLLTVNHRYPHLPEVVAEIERRRWRRATLVELLAFAAAHPGVVKQEGWIVALGSKRFGSDDAFSPCISRVVNLDGGYVLDDIEQHNVQQGARYLVGGLMTLAFNE